MKIIQRVGRDQNRVTCSDCSFVRYYHDLFMSQAISEYRTHDCSDDMFYDDEQFCRRCLAGVHSSEHAEKCYYPGHAEMGESA